MRILSRLATGLAVALLTLSIQAAFAEKVPVSVLYRQDSDVVYHAVVPGYSGSQADITGACTLDPDPANCPTPNQTSPAAGEVSYIVVGTTLSLRLPDGRVAVVNCVNRYSSKGNYINRRSCGMPLVENVEAEFTGQTARLQWPIGTDGKKTESETYKVVALLDKR
jgi:hypothetical protein